MVFKCEQCLSTFSRKDSMLRHVGSRHNNNQISTPEDDYNIPSSLPLWNKYIRVKRKKLLEAPKKYSKKLLLNQGYANGDINESINDKEESLEDTISHDGESIDDDDKTINEGDEESNDETTNGEEEEEEEETVKKSTLTMDDMYLDVTQKYVDECKITQIQHYSFLPYSSTALSKNDEIKISIQNMDAYTLPCESYIYIEGKINKPTDTGTATYNFVCNGLAFLFSEMKYELNGTEIQKIKYPGITSCLKGYCSYTPNDLHVLENMGWDIDFDVNDNKTFMYETASFSGCIPLKHLFGFCEDYKKILLNCNQQLILNRSSTDYESIRVVGPTENLEKYKKVSVELSKVIWKMPVVKVSDREKLRLMKVLDSRKPISCAFRTWDLCEYPILPQNTLHSWTVKSSNLLEKPRFVIIGFQTDRKNNLFNPSSRFDSCNLYNLKVYLNSEVFPHENFRLDFQNKITSVLYKAYADFQKSYYDKERSEPLLPKFKFDTFAPIVVVDLSRQNDNVKSSSVDLRLEFETTAAIPENTTAYCLILHDQIITYSPFNGEVRKL